MASSTALLALSLCALAVLNVVTSQYPGPQAFDAELGGLMPTPFDKSDDFQRAQRAMKRPQGELAWRDVYQELARNGDKLDFGRLKNVRFGLGRR